ncbi:hypothetical protein I7I48_08839 [Histoplasma ohiense]|nr:hypothetical protein I7I48_08839 [Histoplasma ohiense (nom. inval.)]
MPNNRLIGKTIFPPRTRRNPHKHRCRLSPPGHRIPTYSYCAFACQVLFKGWMVFYIYARSFQFDQDSYRYR